MSRWTVLQFLLFLGGIVITGCGSPSPLWVAIGSFVAGHSLAYFIVQMDLRNYSLIRNNP